jgi:hypothetical protein
LGLAGYSVAGHKAAFAANKAYPDAGSGDGIGGYLHAAWPTRLGWGTGVDVGYEYASQFGAAGARYGILVGPETVG